VSNLIEAFGALKQFWPVAVALGLMLAPVRKRWWWAVVLGGSLIVTLGGLCLGIVSVYAVRVQALICITAILAVSLTFINGVTGLFSIGHAGFMIVGAYVSGILTALVFKLAPGTPLALAVPVFLLSLVLGGAASAATGLVVGLPTLRLRGDYLAIATIGFAEIIGVVLRFVTFDREVGGAVVQVGGPRGVPGVPAMPGPVPPGFDGNTAGVAAAFVYSLLILALVVWLLRNYIFSTHGRACCAVRDDEAAAEILGVDTVFYKVHTFVVGAFFAGVGGGLLAHWSNFIHPSMGGFVRSIEYLIVVYLGGIGSLSGGILAAALLTIMDVFLKDLLQGRDAWRMAIYGAILVAVILRRPNGLYGGREFRWLLPAGRRRDARS